jgi:hypothetical protein
VQAVLEEGGLHAEGASVALRVEGYWPAWPEPAVLGVGGLHTFVEVPAFAPAHIRGVAPWEAVPDAEVDVPTGSSVTVDVTLREVVVVSLPYALPAGDDTLYVYGDGSLYSNATGYVPLSGSNATVWGSYFSTGDSGRVRLQGRELVLGPLDLGGIQVTRRIFVPPSGAFVRVIDVLGNAGGLSGPTPLSLWRSLYSGGGAFTVVAKSGPGLEVTAEDAFVVASAPTAVAALVFAGAGRPNPPDSFYWDPWQDGISVGEDWSALPVPADGQLLVMQFLVSRPAGGEAAAEAQAAALMNLTDPDALLGLTAAEKAALYNFVVP